MCWRMLRTRKRRAVAKTAAKAGGGVGGGVDVGISFCTGDGSARYAYTRTGTRSTLQFALYIQLLTVLIL